MHSSVVRPATTRCRTPRARSSSSSSVSWKASHSAFRTLRSSSCAPSRGSIRHSSEPTSPRSSSWTWTTGMPSARARSASGRSRPSRESASGTASSPASRPTWRSTRTRAVVIRLLFLLGGWGRGGPGAGPPALRRRAPNVPSEPHRPVERERLTGPAGPVERRRIPAESAESVEHRLHGFVRRRLLLVLLAAPAGVENDPRPVGVQRNGAVQGGVRTQEVHFPGRVRIGADLVLGEVFVDPRVVLVPVRVRNGLQLAAELRARGLDDPDDGEAEVAPVPAVGVALLVLADEDVLLLVPRAGQDRLGRDAGQGAHHRLGVVDGSHELAVLLDGLLAHRA